MNRTMNVAQVKEALIIAIEKDRWVNINNHFKEFSIFDWWKDYLTVSDMKKMLTFCRFAESHGFNGYVCFKVGISGCGNGMWAYKSESTDGYSPDGDVVYRSFTPAYTDWNAEINGEWVLDLDSTHSRSELENALNG